ncbi:MAG TPA: hypothetical protein VLU43_13740 [Anaeromyxobacteraceae bacterium]|nr:hypothetical protein [Anaeromyxobacteraceae bacterium]
MTGRAIAIAAVVALGACAHAPPLHPALPDQAVAGDPHAGFAVVSGVRFLVHLDAWAGWPEDLDSYATPVDVSIENGAGVALRVRPGQFTLAGPDGHRFAPMPPREVRQLFASFTARSAYGAPYGPWGPWWTPYGPAGAYAGPPPRGAARWPLPYGRLEPDDRMSAVLFFPVAATSLPGAAVEIEVTSEAGQPLGRVQVPFTRGAPSAGARPPASAPPGPPPAAQPQEPGPGVPPPAPTDEWDDAG